MAPPDASQLNHWLTHLERLHPASIELGLSRVAAVAERLGIRRPRSQVITVAGTNGKGSVVHLLEQWLRRQGARVGAYSSPHLQRYNERVRINGVESTDAELCAAFAQVEAKRGDTALTYFEFGTLAAVQQFVDADLDFWLLEVGLGGRLDAVNVIEPDIAVITTVDYDHQDWLGRDLGSIAREKAGIMRAGRPAVVAMPAPPAPVQSALEAPGAVVRWRGEAFDLIAEADGSFEYRSPSHRLSRLRCALPPDSVAAALAVAEALPFAMEPEAVKAWLEAAALPGRFQRLELGVPVVLDVAHNPQGARLLGKRVAGDSSLKPLYAVLGTMADKDLAGVVAPLQPVVAAWFPAAPRVSRATPVEALVAGLQQFGAKQVSPGASVADALDRALQAASETGGGVLVYGSFYTVGEALDACGATPQRRPPR